MSALGRDAVSGDRVLRLAGDRVTLRLRPRPLAVCLLLLLLAAVVALAAVATGDYPIALGEVVAALVGDGTRATTFVVQELRLPRALDALLVGGALGVAGAIFQSLVRNPLGSPDVIGFTQGAAAGAVLEMALVGGGAAAVAGGAIAGGLTTAALVYGLAFRGGRVEGYRLVLVGIGFSSLFASLTAFLLTRVSLDVSQGARVWLVGSLNGRGWEHVGPVAAALALLTPAVAALAAKLRALELGDELAAGLGVEVERTRLLLVLCAVGLTAVATASAGPIAFVALAAPQLARRLTRSAGPNLFAAGLMGALLLTLSDLAAQRLFPSTPLPVGVVTGAVGGAYLVWLLFGEWRTRRR